MSMSGWSSADSWRILTPRWWLKEDWLTQEQALRVEMVALEQRQREFERRGIHISSQPIGVCFSGGGVRSACLALGLLWRLAERNLLVDVSRISAVSGGTYAMCGFASDVVALWHTMEPRNSDVHSWYRQALLQTVQRFQRNANFTLFPVKVFQRLHSETLKRILGVGFFSLLMVFMLAVHPATFFLFMMIPIVVYFNTFHAPLLRYAYCAPPFECLNDQCTKTQPRTGWIQMLINTDYYTAVALLGVTVLAFIMTLLQCSGVLLRLQTSQRCISLMHFLHGLNMMMRRVLIICACGLLLIFLVLGVQLTDYGSVSSIWQQGKSSLLTAKTPVGWRLDFNDTLLSFPMRLDSGLLGSEVLRFGTWYSCYNYTMSRWRIPSWAPMQGYGPGCTSNVSNVAELDRGHCADIMLRTSFAGTLSWSLPGDSLPEFWQDWSFGAFYWGIHHKAGCSKEGIGPLNATQVAFYSRWHSTCEQAHQTMCFLPAHDLTAVDIPIAGCCSTSRFAYVGCLILVFALAVGTAMYFIADTFLLLKVIFMLAGPLVGLYVLAALLRWKVFGPITQAPSVRGQGQTLEGTFFAYTFKNWQWVFWCMMTLALACLPCFDLLQRVTHLYYRSCLVNAYYAGGEDFLLSTCRNVVTCPTLLFGSTILMHRGSYKQKEPHGLFCLSTHAVGSHQARYMLTPDELQVSRAMACSGAAIETALMTGLDSWAIRFWVLTLNLMQGDWLRFRSKRVLGRRMTPSQQRCIDALPSLLLFALCYVLAMGAEYALNMQSCMQGMSFLIVAFVVISVVFAATFFIPLCHCLMHCLQPSPLVRLMQMILVATPVTPNEPPPYVYLGDGGLLENSGCLEMLRRKVPHIIVMEAGDERQMQLFTLKRVLHWSMKEKLCSFFVPNDPRKEVWEAFDEYRQDAQRTFLHLGILYTSEGPGEERAVGNLFWIQNRRVCCRHGMPCTDWPQWGHFPPSNDVRAEPASAASVPSGTARSGFLHDSLQVEEGAERPPLSDLQDCCWDGCRPRCCGRWCGTFPFISTLQQWFSPSMAANFMHYGYYLAGDAVDALEQVRRDVH